MYEFHITGAVLFCLSLLATAVLQARPCEEEEEEDEGRKTALFVLILDLRLHDLI